MSVLERAPGGPEIEVTAKATRRRFTVEYKRKIVREADACKTPGAVGALLRREGLYSSHLTTWRAARERGDLAGAPKKRGPARRVVDPRDKRISELERERTRWQKRAEPWSNCKNKWRRCWERRWLPRPRDGDGHPDRTAAGDRPHVRGARPAARHVLPPAPARTGRAAAAAFAAGARGGRARRGPRAVAHATLRGSRAGGDLRHPARRGHVSLFRTDDVSPPGRARRGAGAARSAPASRLCRPGAAGPPAQRALELGHHQAARAGEVDLLLPVRDARRLQPLRGRLDGGPSRERDAGRAVHPRDVRPARHWARAAHDSRRPRPGHDLEVRGVPAGRSRRDQDAFAAPRVQRQPVLGGAVQDAEVPAGVPGTVRLDPRRSGPRARLLPLVQHRTSPQRPRAAHTPRRALRLGRAARGRTRRRARDGVRHPSRAVSRGLPDTRGGADRGLDQSPHASRARGGGAHSLNSATDCLIPIDRLRTVV